MGVDISPMHPKNWREKTVFCSTPEEARSSGSSKPFTYSLSDIHTYLLNTKISLLILFVIKKSAYKNILNTDSL